MSQEGTNLPQEVEGIHDEAIILHDSILATVTVTPAGSNSSSVSMLASAVDNAGLSERANPAVLSTGEDCNTLSKIASYEVLQDGEDSSAMFKISRLAVPQAGKDSNAASKIASLAVLLADKENKAEFKLSSPAVPLAGEEKGNEAARSNLASLTMLHDSDNSKARPHAGADNNNARSKLASSVVLPVGDGNNGGSKIANPAMLHASEHNDAGFKVPNPTVLYDSKDMDNNAEQPKFVDPILLHAGEDNKVRTKLAIQAVSHAGGNAGSSRLTRSAVAALHAAKENASKIAIQVVSRLHAGKDNNTGSSKAVTRLAAVDADETKLNNAKRRNNVAREQGAHKGDVGDVSGKGNTTMVEDADLNLHIFSERERRKKMKNMFSTLHMLLPQLPDKADKVTIVGEAITHIRTLEGTLHKLEKMKLERKHALAAQQHDQQQQLAVGAGSSSRVSSACHPSQALPAPAPALSREANLADMVNCLAQQAAMAAKNKALAVAATVARAGGSVSSSSSGTATNVHLPRGAVPFPAPAAGFQTWSGQNLVVSVANDEAYINLNCPREPGTLTKVLFVLERHHIEVVTTTISAQDGFRMYGIHARANPASASARFPENLCAEDRFKLAASEMMQLINNWCEANALMVMLADATNHSPWTWT